MEQLKETEQPLPCCDAEICPDGETAAPPSSFLRDVLAAYRRNRLAMAGAAVVLLLFLMALFAPWLTPYDPYAIDLEAMTEAPSWAHWLGTDQFGRDLLTRILYGTRISLVIGVVPTLMSMAIGTTLGLAGGFYGGKVDMVIMRLCDIVLAFPSLLLITTLFRVGLNVSSTRLILSNGGNAGQVIKTFGEFVIGDNVVVGIVIFIIVIFVGSKLF